MLSYISHQGRIELIHPTADKLADTQNYLIQRSAVNLIPRPVEKAKSKKGIAEDFTSKNATHRLAFKVFGGYGPDSEGAHFKFAQPAHYRTIKFTLDLNNYPDTSVIKKPELIMIPVLKDRPFDCCDLARKGQGLPIKPEVCRGLYYEWSFSHVADVMIGVHWKIDHDKIPPGFRVDAESSR